MKIRVDFEHHTFANSNNPLGEATVPKLIFLCQCCVCVLTVLLNCDTFENFENYIGITWGNNRHCLKNLGIEFLEA